jgi:hypothetical protein
MDIIKLILIFSCIVVVIKLKKPLYVSIFAGIFGAILLYGISPLESIKLMKNGAFSLGTINLVLAFYTITFLQRMMEKRAHLILAEKSLNNLFNSRRVNAMIAIALPLAYASIPSGGLALMILIMCTTYIANQVSPTHICLGIIIEHYDISFIDLVKKTIPIVLIFIVISSLYSYLLYLLL